MNVHTIKLTGASLMGAWLLTLAGCAAPDSAEGTAAAAPAATEKPEQAAKQCKADDAQYAIGQQYTPELGEKVKELSGSSVVRTLRPGQVVTMEYRFDRVSVHLDDKGYVTRVTCG